MAKDVITRFKLETTGFDSKIKEAAKELSAYSKTATQAKEGFNQFTKANVDAAKALGTMATSTTNVKDRAKELVGAYNEAAKAYEALSDEHKQSDWAKALAGSLTQLQQRIKETKAEMQGLGDSMKGANDGSLLSKLGGKMDGALAVFGGNLMTKAAGMGVGLVTEMTDAVKQGIELAKAGEGVRIAFERLGRGDILQGLREATHGTVTDLELMKAAVKFNDFKLPVEELGTMLAFAQQKAKDTGQSVDYMVDSIVTGLGRKSLMILDNLGLSATEIRERMKETGDMTKAVGAIIREQMAAAGEYVETAADRAAQANVSLQNKMEELGRKVAPLEESFNNLWTSMKVGILDVIGGPLTDLLNKLTQAGRMASQYSLMGGNTKVGRMTSNLANASEDSRQSIYQLQKSQFWKYINPREQQIQDIRAWQSGERNETLQKRINVITQKYGSLDTTKIQAEVDAAKKMLADYEQAAKSILQPVNAGINTDKAEQNVASLRRQLKELEKQRKDAVKSGDQEQVENLTKQISQVKTNLGYLDPKANKTGSSSKTAQTELQENKAKIDALTQQFVDINAEASRAGKPLTEEQKKQTEEIQKQIEALKQRNGLLNRFAEQAQGRLLSNDDMKRKAEIDMQVNTKQIEDLRRQLTEIEGVTIDPKSVTITATDEALPKLREIEGITIDDKTMTVTAETADALRELQGIEGVTIDPKSVTITATNEAMPKLREIEGITIDDKTMTVTANTADALRALQGIEGVTIDPKTVDVNANTSEAQQKIDELKAKIAELEDKNISIQTFIDNVGKPLGEQQLNNTPGTLLKAPTTAVYEDGVKTEKAVPRGGLQLDDKAMKAVAKNLNFGESKNEKDIASDVSSLVSGVNGVFSGIQSLGIKLPDEFEGLLRGIQGITSILTGISSLMTIIAAIQGVKATPVIGWALANGGVVPGFANGGVIDSGHSPSFLSFSKSAPAFATGGVVPQTITSMPKFATGGIIPKFNEGGTVEAGHAPDFLSFSKAMPKFATGGVVPQVTIPMPKFATGGIIQKFNDGGTVEAGHAPDFLSFSKAMPKFATGGTIAHANSGYFVGGTHFSGDVTPIMANAGELVLNKAQQGNLASQLQGGGMQGLNLYTEISMEKLRIGLNSNSKRRGKGEYVTSNRL